MRNEFACVSDALESYDFVVKHVGYTLVAWGMDSQKAELSPPDKFYSQFKDNRHLVVELEQYSIADLSNPVVVTLIWDTIRILNLSKTRSQLVTGSKAIHHLLPNLLPPIDRQYTGKFSKLYQHHYTDNAKSGLERVIEGFAQINKLLRQQYGTCYLSSLVGKTQWATSETKLIDNAIIGFVKKHNL
ncbi:MAG: hypothetical protein OXD31_12095 [Chloroflexi bacterium]|nr:hypothetical protein [Chloroflexota bacterium]